MVNIFGWKPSAPYDPCSTASVETGKSDIGYAIDVSELPSEPVCVAQYRPLLEARSRRRIGSILGMTDVRWRRSIIEQVQVGTR
jgi:hypothetical protein